MDLNRLSRLQSYALYKKSDSTEPECLQLLGQAVF